MACLINLDLLYYCEKPKNKTIKREAFFILRLKGKKHESIFMGGTLI